MLSKLEMFPNLVYNGPYVHEGLVKVVFIKIILSVCCKHLFCFTSLTYSEVSNNHAAHFINFWDFYLPTWPY